MRVADCCGLRTAVPLAVALFVTACSSAAGREALEPRALAVLFEGGSADYEPAKTPADLAARSEIVVEGSVSTVTRGRVWGTSADNAGSSVSVVLNVDVTRILVGNLPARSDGTVYVELQSHGNVPASAYAAALPADTRGVFYLVTAPLSGADIVEPGAGRPVGQPLYEVTTPQGMVLGDDAVTQQLGEGRAPEGSDLRDFLPASERFPDK